MKLFTRRRALALVGLIITAGAVAMPNMASAFTEGASKKTNTTICYVQDTEYQYQKQTHERSRESVESEWGPWSDWAWWSPASYKWSSTLVDVLEGPAQHGGNPNGTYYREYKYVPNGQSRVVNGAETPCPTPDKPSGTVVPECSGIVATNTGNVPLVFDVGGGAYTVTIQPGASIKAGASLYDADGFADATLVFGDVVLFADVVHKPADCGPKLDAAGDFTLTGVCGANNDTVTLTGVVNATAGAPVWANGKVSVTFTSITDHVFPNGQASFTKTMDEVNTAKCTESTTTTVRLPTTAGSDPDTSRSLALLLVLIGALVLVSIAFRRSGDQATS